MGEEQGDADRARAFLLTGEELSEPGLDAGDVISALCSLAPHEGALTTALGTLYEAPELLEEVLQSDTARLSELLATHSSSMSGDDLDGWLFMRAPELPIEWARIEPCIHWLARPSQVRCLLSWAAGQNGAPLDLKRRFRVRMAAHQPEDAFEMLGEAWSPTFTCHCEALLHDAANRVDIAEIVRQIASRDDSWQEIVASLGRLPRQRAETVVLDSPRLCESITAAFADVSDFDYDKDARIQALRLLPVDELEREAVGIGRFIARNVALRVQRDATAVADFLDRPVTDIAGTSICEIALLWLHLRALAAYEQDRSSRPTEAAAVTDDLLLSVAQTPRAWASSVEALLQTSKELPRGSDDLLAMACLKSEIITAAVERVMHDASTQRLRDRAHGLLLDIGASPEVGDAVRHWVADVIGLRLDARLPFPRPFTPLAGTWLGSLAVEDTLQRGVLAALQDVAPKLRDFGPVEEEALTMAVLQSLENALSGAKLALDAAGASARDIAVSLDYSQVPKSDERTWGCDLALILEAEVPRQMSLSLATLVQVKKSLSVGNPGRRDEGWAISLEQLGDIQQRTDAAFYWLLLSTGTIACVPAHVLSGIVAARRRRRSQRTLNVGYTEVRHAAIPLTQFIPELVIGTWVGTSLPSVVSFARGEDSRVTPRHIVTISLRSDAVVN